MKRLLLALAVLSLLLSAPKAQAQECVSELKLRLFPRTLIGQQVCVRLQFISLIPLSSIHAHRAGDQNKYLVNFARLYATNGKTWLEDDYGRYEWLLVPVTSFDRISQIKKGDWITVHGRIARVVEISPFGFSRKPQPVMEVNRIDHGGEHLQLDLKLKGRK